MQRLSELDGGGAAGRQGWLASGGAAGRRGAWGAPVSSRAVGGRHRAQRAVITGGGFSDQVERQALVADNLPAAPFHRCRAQSGAEEADEPAGRPELLRCAAIGRQV